MSRGKERSESTPATQHHCSKSYMNLIHNLKRQSIFSTEFPKEASGKFYALVCSGVRFFSGLLKGRRWHCSSHSERFYLEAIRNGYSVGGNVYDEFIKKEGGCFWIFLNWRMGIKMVFWNNIFIPTPPLNSLVFSSYNVDTFEFIM